MGTNTVAKVQLCFLYQHFNFIRIVRNYVDFAAKIHHWLVILRQRQVEKYRASANSRILSTKKKSRVIAFSSASPARR
jgi:hypothetical protein